MCAVAFCLFVRWAGLFFTWAFPLVCLVKVLTDLPSSASSAAPDVEVGLLRSDLGGLQRETTLEIWISDSDLNLEREK